MNKSYFLLLIILILLICACKSNFNNAGQLTEFRYEFGSFSGGYWNYHIFEEDGKLWLEGKGSNGVE